MEFILALHTVGLAALAFWVVRSFFEQEAKNLKMVEQVKMLWTQVHGCHDRVQELSGLIDGNTANAAARDDKARRRLDALDNDLGTLGTSISRRLDEHAAAINSIRPSVG